MISALRYTFQRYYYKYRIKFYVLLLDMLPSSWARDRLNKALNKASPNRFLKIKAPPAKVDTDTFNHYLHREFNIWEKQIRSHSLDYYRRTKAYCSSRATSKIEGAGSAFIIDPHFNPFQEPSGHHSALNKFYNDLLNEMRFDVKIFGKFSMPTPSERLKFSFMPTFTTDLYKQPTAFMGLTGQIQSNLYFKKELEKNVSNVAKVYIAPSVRHNIVLGLASWIKTELDQEGRCIAIGIIDNQLGTNSKIDREVRELYRQAFALLRQIRKSNLLIYCETAAQIEILNESGAKGLDLRLFPYFGGSLALRFVNKINSEHRKDAKIRIGFVGTTRIERGAHLVPDLVQKVNINLSERISWLLQLDLDKLKKIKGVSTKSLATLTDVENINLFDGALASRDYYSLLNKTDIVILPYLDRYEATGSGVFIEALSLGKVLVVPKKGWLAEAVSKCGGQPITFDAADVDNISNAIQFAITNFSHLQDMANNAARTWNSHEASGSQIRSWLGKKLPDPPNQNWFPS